MFLEFYIDREWNQMEKNIYELSDASHDDLLQLSNSVSLLQRHLQFLLREIYKSTGTLNPEFMW